MVSWKSVFNCSRIIMPLDGKLHRWAWPATFETCDWKNLHVESPGNKQSDMKLKCLQKGAEPLHTVEGEFHASPIISNESCHSPPLPRHHYFLLLPRMPGPNDMDRVLVGYAKLIADGAGALSLGSSCKLGGLAGVDIGPMLKLQQFWPRMFLNELHPHPMLARESYNPKMDFSFNE